MSKKNFCHIRFGSEASVDLALKVSGFRMKIDGKNDSQNTGKLHVDFAKARDDQVRESVKLMGLVGSQAKEGQSFTNSS